MKVPINWLKDFVDVEISPPELAEKLVSAGFEIEEIINQADNVKNVVVGKIVGLSAHPNANKLQLVDLDIGAKATLRVVTGATNVRVGDVVPVATDGAELYGKKIVAGALRGEMSYGMLCSGSELNLTEEDIVGASVNGILQLPKDTPLGMDINDFLGTNDIILDVAVTANRPDCNSIIGIAGEVAAVTGKKVKLPDISYNTVKDNVNDILKVSVKATDLCPRYMASAVTGVKIEKSPEIIKRRLKSVGHNSINNIVDITNYILVELGQPMHAFDIKNLEGSEIIVRRANENEKITCLDKKEYTLNGNVLVICDKVKPVAMAGIMGGLNSGISEGTSTIVFESARFARDNIRHNSRAIGIKSDSSTRFEKGIDFYSQEFATKRALHFISKYNWGKILSGTIDVMGGVPFNKKIEFSSFDIKQILGIGIPADKILSILNSLGINTVKKDNLFVSEIPGMREDIVGKNDIAEELIRIYGYSHIVPTLMADSEQKGGKRNNEQKLKDKLKATLEGFGYSEIITYSFISPRAFDMLNIPNSGELRKAVVLSNALGEDLSVMRTTLAHSMLKILASNFNKGNQDAKLFETASVYIPKELPLIDLPNEIQTVCMGAYGENTDFYLLKSAVTNLLDALNVKATYKRAIYSYLHQGRSADVYVGDKKVGYLGEVDPDVSELYGISKRVYIAELNQNEIINKATLFKDFMPIPKFPIMERDLALLVTKDVTADDILNSIYSLNIQILESAKIFDVYEGVQVAKGMKSVAVKLIFREPTRTLKENEVNEAIEKILALYQLRS